LHRLPFVEFGLEPSERLMCGLPLHLNEYPLELLRVNSECVRLPELLLPINAYNILSLEHKVDVAVIEELLKT
jgi:hypothetical protein